MVKEEYNCENCGNQLRRKKKYRICDSCLTRRTCKECNQPMNSNDPRKVVCNLECAARSFSRHIEVICVVCKIPFMKSAWNAKTKPVHCCSAKCQLKWRTIRSHIAMRESGKWPDWSKAALAQKRKWKRQYSASRFAKCEWRVAVRNKLRPRETEVDEWLSRISIRLQANKGRVSKSCCSGGSSGILEALRKVHSRRIWYMKDEWEKKINNKLSNATKRRSRKHEQKRKMRTNQTEDRGVWVQMCIEWVANNS